jgi:hypothetical protein
MSVATSDIWEAMSTAQTIRRFTDEPLADVVNLDHWDQPYRQQEKRRP